MNTTDDRLSGELPFGALAPTPWQRAVIAVARGSHLKRGTFRPMLSRLVSMLRPGPIDATYQGASFRFHHEASGTERGALFNPDYNLAELDFLRRHAPVGGVVIDIGANVGTYTLAMARHVGERGRVIAIEPHPVSRGRLTFNTEASRLANVTIVAAAAADIAGDLTIETDADNLGASHVSDSPTASGIKVPALPLLSILHDAGVTHVDAMKIDIEGYEDRALTSFFRDAPPELWPTAVAIEHLERESWRRDCIDDMLVRGYTLAGKTRSNTLLVGNQLHLLRGR